MSTITQLRKALGGVPGRSVFVPTMGALHQGHASLIMLGVGEARARGFASGVVVSVFVNAAQFNEAKDFDRYPRTLDTDRELCERAGAAILFAPSPSEIYPHRSPPRMPDLPAVATTPGLEDAHRPGHFAGVCLVVRRLFEIVEPACAILGEKDWQQLAVIRAMTADERLPIDILGAPTLREADGLAMSSRNRFLAPQERESARAISLALREACEEPTPARAESRMARVLEAARIKPEYAVVRDARTLLPQAVVEHAPLRALIAAKVGATRLIDNAPWKPNMSSHTLPRTNATLSRSTRPKRRT